MKMSSRLGVVAVGLGIATGAACAAPSSELDERAFDERGDLGGAEDAADIDEVAELPHEPGVEAGIPGWRSSARWTLHSGAVRVPLTLESEHLLELSTIPAGDGSGCFGERAVAHPTSIEVRDDAGEVVHRATRDECTCGVSRTPDTACTKTDLPPGRYQVIVRGPIGASVQWTVRGEPTRCFWDERIAADGWPVNFFGATVRGEADRRPVPDFVVTPASADVAASRVFLYRSEIISALSLARIEGLVPPDILAVARQSARDSPPSPASREFDRERNAAGFRALLERLDGQAMRLRSLGRPASDGYGVQNTHARIAAFSFQGHEYVVLIEHGEAVDAVYRDGVLATCYLNQRRVERTPLTPSPDTASARIPLPLATFAVPYAHYERDSN